SILAWGESLFAGRARTLVAAAAVGHHTSACTCVLGRQLPRPVAPRHTRIVLPYPAPLRTLPRPSHQIAPRYSLSSGFDARPHIQIPPPTRPRLPTPFSGQSA